MKRITGVGLASQGDWNARLLLRVSAAGFSSIADLADDNPTASVIEVVERLNATNTDDNPLPNSADQLTGLWRKEACISGDAAIKKFCIRTLVGELHRNLVSGWPAEITETTAFPLIQTWTTWSAMLAPEWRDKARSVWVALREAPPPRGWRPSGSEDPLLTEVFDTNWSTSKTTTLRLIGNFLELGYAHHSNAPKLSEYRNKLSPEHKTEIVQYLRAGKMFILSPGIDDDVLDSSRRADTGSVLTDGTYAWEQQLAYYVERYDVELSPEFNAHMEANRWQIPESVDTAFLRMPQAGAEP
jgi:hypothetical protein